MVDSPVVYLDSKRAKTVLAGHPWVFPKAIARTKGRLVTGELVRVLTADEEYLGVGVYNEHSLYRIRMLFYSFESQETHSVSTIVAYRLRQALMVRRRLGLPNKQTTAYRIFNSEGDGLSGLTIDCFNQLMVVASSAFWLEKHKNIIESLVRDILSPHTLVWLSQTKPLLQDGWEVVESSSGISSKEQVLEAGVLFEVDFVNPQKTGLFLDQRDNHQRMANLAKGKRVLDLYTYTGGFALHAAKAGASHVVAVDSSAQAIELAKRNAELNQLTTIDFVEADARDYLVQAGQYDLVILDPPKLVPSQRHKERAKNYYRFLHRETFKHMMSGTLLMTCNCSAALSTQEFTSLIGYQAMAVGKMVRILGVYGPSSCHPILAEFPEGQYLTAVLLVIL